jgi:hypothetical protein
MQDRIQPQSIFRPVDDEGQRIPIGAVSITSEALTTWKKHHVWASKPCWICVGNAAVVAVAAAGGPPAIGGTAIPLSAGGVYEYEPKGTNDRYIAVIQDPNYDDVDGWLFIARAET